MTLHGPHDALFRAAFESPRHAANLLACLLPPELSGLVVLESLELQSGAGRGKHLEEFRSDLSFRATIADSPGFVCFLLEHQSSSDSGMPLRVLGYLVRAWERCWRGSPGEPLPPIVPVVISHDPKGWRAPREFAELLPASLRGHEALHTLTPHFRCIVDDLAQLSDSDLKRRALGAFPSLALWALRDARSPGQILRTLDHWTDALTDAANAEGGRDALAQLFMYIATVADNLAFEELHARLAQLGPPVEETIMTIAEQLKARGLEQGLQRGLEQGRRDSLRKLLALKFGLLSAAVEARLETAELAALDRWLERVLSADSAEAAVEL